MFLSVLLRICVFVFESKKSQLHFNKTPLGPVGCCDLVHAKPATRQFWDFRVKPGFYIGPALNK
jgi:hypothetical protein